MFKLHRLIFSISLPGILLLHVDGARADAIKINRNTYLKTAPARADQLKEFWFNDPQSSNFCLVELKAGQKLELSNPKIVFQLGHGYVQLKQAQTSYEFPGCVLSQGYIETVDFEKISLVPPAPPAPPAVAKGLARTPLVLLYHDVVATRDQLTSDSDVTADALRNHLTALKSQGYSFIKLDEYWTKINKGQAVSATAVIVTFDDGYIGNFENALPILQELSVPATFFVHTDYVGEGEGAKPHMNWEELQTLEEHSLFSVESHTLSHSKLTTLSAIRIKQELVESKKEIEARLKKKVRFLAYPYGAFDTTVKSLALRSYDLAFAVENQAGQVDRLTIPRMSLGRSNLETAQFLQSLKIWRGRFQ